MKRSETTLTLPELIRNYKTRQEISYDFRRAQTIAQIYHSTALDGSPLTFDQIGILLETDESVTAQPQQEWMVIDYQRAQNLIIEWASTQEPLNRLNIQRLGAFVMRQTGGISEALLCDADSRKGEFRSNQLNGTGGFYERPNKLVERIDVLSKQTNADLRVNRTVRQFYETSFFIHYQFLRIHPFVAGNGRVARLLMNYVQLYRNLPISVVFVEDRHAYNTALNASFQASSTKPFYDFMFGQLTKLLTLNSLEDSTCDL